MTVDLLLTEAVVHLPGSEVVEGWLAVEDGHIESLGDGEPPPARSVIPCQGKWVMPGLVDIHVHFRDPGFTYKEDFLTGSAAAAAGGVTAVLDMPNTEDLVITPDDLRRKIEALDGRSYVDFGLYALLADSAPHVESLSDLGVAGLKWLLGYENLHGQPCQPSNNARLRETLQRAADLGVLVGVHAEDSKWVGDLAHDLEAQGRSDAAAHGASRPPFVEALAVAEASILAAEFGCRLHVHHLSSAQGLRVLNLMRQGLSAPVTAETCPHYLYLSEDDLDELGSRGRVNPPLRGFEDLEALWAGIEAGAIDCIASDHAPHAPEEKSVESIWSADSGFIGVETMFPLLFHEVHSGRLDTAKFVELTSERPAEIVGLGHRKGKLLPGHDADLIVVDPASSTVISSGNLHSKHSDTPFEGFERRGSIEAVYLRGNLIVDHGQIETTPLGMYAPSRHGATTASGPWRM